MKTKSKASKKKAPKKASKKKAPKKASKRMSKSSGKTTNMLVDKLYPNNKSKKTPAKASSSKNKQLLMELTNPKNITKTNKIKANINGDEFKFKDTEINSKDMFYKIRKVEKQGLNYFDSVMKNDNIYFLDPDLIKPDSLYNIDNSLARKIFNYTKATPISKLI